MLEMPDFRLINTSPKRGNLVLDFGKAYQIAEDLQTLKHRSGGGHRTIRRVHFIVLSNLIPVLLNLGIPVIPIHQ